VTWSLTLSTRLAPGPSTATWFARTWCADFSRQYPVPTYVVEFLLGRYCASIDEEEIQEGSTSCSASWPSPHGQGRRAGAVQGPRREEGSVKLIDLITARLDAKTDSYVADLPSLQLKDVRIGRAGARARANADRRLLRRGRAGYDAAIAAGGVGSALRCRGPAGDPALQARCSDVLARARALYSERGVEGVPAAQYRAGARGSE
jgi:ATP-dependent Lon protease